jgi:phosphorylcholine metabolism protein LicD
VLGIPYVLVAGSLLGAVRSRSLLFCDDDADIAVFEEDYAKVI